MVIKTKKTVVIILSCIIILVFIGATYAAFTASSDPIQREVSASGLKIEINQEADTSKVLKGEANVSDSGIQYSGGMPGDEVKGAVSVLNTEQKPCYIRVTIHRSWKSSDGTKQFHVNPEQIQILRNDSSDWLVMEDPALTGDKEVIYCYYKKMVPQGKKTSNVMDSFTVLTKPGEQTGNEYSGLYADIQFGVNAIQTTAAEEAMLAEWGIIASFDESGMLVGYEEQ